MKDYTKKTRSSREKNNAYMREYMKRKRSTEDPQSKQKRNEKDKEYKKRKRSEPLNQSIESLILSFHNIVSQGPLHICSCCDQLWYKHSVLPEKKFFIKLVLITLNGCVDHVINT